MRWAQVQGGQRLHLALEPGEETPDGEVIRKGYLSAPICGRGLEPRGHYRMTCDLPLGNACRRCTRIAKQQRGGSSK